MKMYSEKIKSLIKKSFIFNKAMCATIIGTPAFNTLYNLPLHNSTEYSPIPSNKVVEYRERNLRVS